MKSPVRPISLAIAAALAASCAGKDGPPPRPNVVVYLCDTLRADWLGCYGNPDGLTPMLDELARDSAVFLDAQSQAPWTVPSVASLMTSTYPSTHGIVSPAHKLPESATTMAEFFKESGYHTALFTQSPYGGSVTALDQGYDDLFERGKQWPTGHPFRHLQPFFSWLEDRQDESPFFTYIHTVEPHYPMVSTIAQDAGEGAARRLAVLNKQFGSFRKLTRRTLRKGAPDQETRAANLAKVKSRLARRREEVREFYAHSVRWADKHVREVVDALESRGLWENTIFVFVSDHGEEFLDHDYWLHDQSLHFELLHVPMIMRVPGLTDGGMRIEDPSQLVDVLPTIAALLGVPPLAQWQGRSLLSYLEGSPPEEPAPVFAIRDNRSKIDPENFEKRGDRETAVIQGRWKLIVHHDRDRVSLYDRDIDPKEERDVSSENADVVARLEKDVDAFVAWQETQTIGSSGEHELDPEQELRLMELGYVDKEPDN